MTYEIRINEQRIDIDDKTSIGINFQAYDVSDPAKPKFTVSNTFTIPKTAKNVKALGFAGNVYFYSTLIYEALSVDIIFANEMIIRGAKARINSISERIELTIYEKDNVWDTMKQMKFDSSVATELLNYLKTKYTFPTSTNKASTLNAFVGYFNAATNGIVMPFFFSNLFNEDPTKSFEGYDFITLSDGDKKGAHFCVYAIDFLKFIENKFNINLSSSDTFPGNIFSDAVLSKMAFVIPHFVTKYDSGYYLAVADGNTKYGEQSLKYEGTILDMFLAVVKYFNIVVTQGFYDGVYKYRMVRFDDIPNYTEVKSFDRNIVSIDKFKPFIDNTGQLNYVKFAKVGESADKYYNAKIITCKNKTLEAVKDYVEIPCYAFDFYQSTLSSKFIPNVTGDKINAVTLMYIDTADTATVNVYYDSNYSSVQLYMPKLYSLENEYNSLAACLEYPKIYEITKIFTIDELIKLDFNALYYSSVLNGTFFINKIEGFNPLQPLKGAKVQLLFVGAMTPKPDVETFYFVDGKGNPFVSYQNNYFVSN